MIDSSPCTLPGNRFLQSVSLCPVEYESDTPFPSGSAQYLAVEQCRQSGLPCVVADAPESEDSIAAALALPIYQDLTIKNILLFTIIESTEAVGVVEVWTPVGRYQELALSSGYFGALERFQNVSSFVRFENGSGLPGQAWSRGHAIIHDDLANHPGFLRAAGASAEALQTAIGIPVFAKDFVSTVALISSADSPLAQGVEVWTKNKDGEFEIDASAYCPNVSEEMRLSVGTVCQEAEGLLGPCLQTQSAQLVSDSDRMNCGRKTPFDSSGAVLIPTFRSGEIASVTSLLL